MTHTPPCTVIPFRKGDPASEPVLKPGMAIDPGLLVAALGKQRRIARAQAAESFIAPIFVGMLDMLIDAVEASAVEGRGAQPPTTGEQSDG